ncbi:MAG: hypothetical protein ACOZNI_05730 [Myxococcota bacterium]
MAEVLAVTHDGRPLEVRFTFPAPLEDPSVRVFAMRDGGIVPWTPPAIGETATLPPIL